MTLNSSKVCPSVVTCYEAHRDGLARQGLHCGKFASVRRHEEDAPESSRKEPSRTPWSVLELLVKCQLDSIVEDPFNDDGDNEPVAPERKRVMSQILSCAELAFKYQQRQFVFMVLFLGHYARVVRFDRSGVVASEKIDYRERGHELTSFLVRYSRLGSEDRGHDPRASRISPTDSLWSLLKRHGADAAKRDSENHVQKVFNESLDDTWSWWRLSVTDEETGVERFFAVGKPHYYASGVVGRATRGYVAVPLNDVGEPEGDFVYLKDAWRLDVDGMNKEGAVLKTLNAAHVTFVPTLLYHGDLNQSTRSYDKWLKYHPGETPNNCPLEAHRHYRLVVAEVCKPLSEFKHSIELVWALVCGIIGMFHRGLSRLRHFTNPC